MGDISIKGRSPLVKGGRVGLKKGGFPIRTRKVKPGYDQEFTLPRGTSAAPIKQSKVGRLTVGKKSKSSPDSETQMKQKIAAQNKKQEIKNKENREEWAEIDKLAGKLKTGAKIIGGVIGTTIVAGEVKHKLKKKDEE